MHHLRVYLVLQRYLWCFFSLLVVGWSTVQTLVLLCGWEWEYGHTNEWQTLMQRRECMDWPENHAEPLTTRTLAKPSFSKLFLLSNVQQSGNVVHQACWMKKSLLLIGIKCWRWRHRVSAGFPGILPRHKQFREFPSCKTPEQQQHSLELLLKTRQQHTWVHSCLNITAEAFTQHSFIFKQLIASWFSPFRRRTSAFEVSFFSSSSAKAQDEIVSSGLWLDADFLPTLLNNYEICCRMQSIHTHWHTHKASSLTLIRDTSKRNRLYMCARVLLEKTLQLHLYFKAEKLSKTGC